MPHEDGDAAADDASSFGVVQVFFLRRGDVLGSTAAAFVCRRMALADVTDSCVSVF